MASFHVIADARGELARVDVHRISPADVLDALRLGFEDFWEKPSHYFFLCLIYPVAGVILITWASTGNAQQLVFPIIAGFALLGPLAALGPYEISRRRELGLDSSWRHAVDVRKSPALPAIIAFGLVLVLVFMAWLLAAQALYVWFYGPAPPESLTGLMRDVLTTRRGWGLLVAGGLTGFVFALAVLTTSVVTFPLRLDRDVGVYAAVNASVRLALKNPVPILLWGFIVAVLLAIASLPLLVGLALVIPILGHATWHLYRKAVA